MKLCLDIEGVLIEDLVFPRILDENVERIQKWIVTNAPTSIETFSFGLWDKADFDTWERVRIILSNIGLNITTQTMDSNTLKMSFLKTVIGSLKQSEIHDFPLISTKDRAFEWFVNEFQEEGSECALIDDRVETKTIITKKHNIKIFNIADLPL